MSRTTTVRGLSLATLAVALLFATAAAAGGHRTAIVAMDDWRPDSGISMGRVFCPGGELLVDPFTGLPVCTPGSRTHIRDAVYYSCIQGSTDDGTPAPRFTGVMSGTMSVNWDAGYSGAVWGSWLLVPTDSCDRSVLEEPEVYWAGSWQGQRTAVCDGEGPCVWIGDLNFVGRGRGGDLEGLRFRGNELILTYTPFPLAYELLAAFGLCQPGSCPTGAEGVFTGTIR